MVTVKLHVEELPEASVAVEVTVVVPRGKVLPEGGDETIVTDPLQLSVAVTAKVTTLLQRPDTMFAGHEITGSVLSILFTLKEHEVLLPARSVTVSVIVVVPIPATGVPAAGDCVFTIDPAGVQLSVIVASPV